MNVFLCLTPLQCIIAEALMKKNSNENFFIYIVDADNEKARAYYNRLKKIAKDGIYLVLSRNKFLNLIKIIFYVRKFGEKTDNVYLASIDNIYMHIALSHLKYKNIYTFDDGFANIYINGLYYLKENYPLYKRILYKVVGGRITMKDIKTASQRHYSIYPRNIPNIIPADNVEEVSLFQSYKEDGMQCDALSTKQIIKIFAGQPLFFGEDEKSKTMIQHAISFVEPDYYFPHPREPFSIENVNIIKTPLIIEDYAIQYVRDNPNVEVKVFSFFSSCLINLCNVKNITVTAIKCDALGREEIYALLKDFSIDIVDLHI